MFNKWRASNFGAYSGDELLEALKKFGDQSESNIKWRSFGADNFLISIVTLLMERIHRNIGEVGEIVFFDSTSNLDATKATFTVLLCYSNVGTLPSAAIVTSSRGGNLLYRR